jgi:hypothetical protein
MVQGEEPNLLEIRFISSVKSKSTFAGVSPATVEFRPFSCQRPHCRRSSHGSENAQITQIQDAQ